MIEKSRCNAVGITHNCFRVTIYLLMMILCYNSYVRIDKSFYRISLIKYVLWYLCRSVTLSTGWFYFVSYYAGTLTFSDERFGFYKTGFVFTNAKLFEWQSLSIRVHRFVNKAYFISFRITNGCLRIYREHLRKCEGTLRFWIFIRILKRKYVWEILEHLTTEFNLVNFWNSYWICFCILQKSNVF